MKAQDVASLACIGVGLLLLVWLLVSGLVGKRRAFPDGDDGVARGSGGDPPVRFRPDPRYFVGLWLVIFAFGISAGLTAAVVLGAFGALALALAFGRSGVVLADSGVTFGTFQAVTVPLEKVGAVVAAPRGAFGRSFGVFGVSDREGNWLAAIRYNTILGGPQAAADLIVNAGLEATGRGRWARPGIDAPRMPLPFLGT